MYKYAFVHYKSKPGFILILNYPELKIYRIDYSVLKHCMGENIPTVSPGPSTVWTCTVQVGGQVEVLYEANKMAV